MMEPSSRISLSSLAFAFLGLTALVVLTIRAQHQAQQSELEDARKRASKAERDLDGALATISELSNGKKEAGAGDGSS